MSPRLRIALLLAPALLVVGVFVVGGVLQAVLQSLGHAPVVGESQWSLDAYRRVLADPAVHASLLLTARVSLISTAAAAVLGTALALLVRRLGGRRRLAVLFHGTLAVPHLVGALAIGLLLAPSGLLSRAAYRLGLVDSVQDVPALTQDAFGWGIIAEYTWKETFFVAVVALAALGRRVGDLEDVAATLGASRWQRLREVTLPVLEPPRAALTNVSDFYLGVGMLVVVDGGLEIPEGMMGEEQLELIFEDGILGNSPRHAIIYREGSTEGIEGLEDLQWPNAFEEGALMCGAGVEREDGFAIFEPSRCDTIELIIGSREWINWT